MAMDWNRLRCLLGAALAVALFAAALLALPADAGARGREKIPPGQVKKMQLNMMIDVRGHWAAEPITAMQKQGIIKGFPGGYFYPQREVTKYQALVMIVRALGLEGQEPSDESAGLVADSGCPDWARDSVALAIDKGIITEEELADMDGRAPAARYEAAVWIGRALPGTISDGEPPFGDAGQIPAWAKKYVRFMAENGIITGYQDNYFRPWQKVRRAEMAAMLFRCMNRYSFNPKFSYLRGTVVEAMDSDPAFLILADGEREVMVLVADDAAIFVDGEAAELADVEKGYAVTVILDSARRAIVVSAQSDGDVDEEEDASEVKKLTPADGAGDVAEGLDTLVVARNGARC